MLRSFFIGAAILLLARPGLADDSAQAFDRLKKAVTTLQSAKSIAVSAVVTADSVDRADSFKLQKVFVIHLRFTRPDKLYAVKSGDENQSIVYDGKRFTVIDPIKKRFAHESLEGTIDDLIPKLEAWDLGMPLIELLQSKLLENLPTHVLQARSVGVSRISGRKCEHLAFRTATADWQLWIDQAAEPTLCKSVITTRGMSQAPQYELTFGPWKLDEPIDPRTFTARIPAAATSVDLNSGIFSSANG